MNKAMLGAMGLATLVGGCGFPMDAAPLEVVKDVELERYAGKWYEIARYPNWFQGDDCDGTTAEYSIREDGTIRVENRCRDLEGGGEDVIVGSARVPDETKPAQLKVGFFGPFEGDYWIIALDEENYEWAVVGEPRRAFFWILSRTPEMDADVFDAIVAQMPEWGYDPERLRITRQVTE
jgi:apolipoprotein D and lipocalin family protein